MMQKSPIKNFLWIACDQNLSTAYETQLIKQLVYSQNNAMQKWRDIVIGPA